jgi:hypothetical protein
LTDLACLEATLDADLDVGLIFLPIRLLTLLAVLDADLEADLESLPAFLKALFNDFFIALVFLPALTELVDLDLLERL